MLPDLFPSQVKLSVIMPLYNVEATLPLALESILMQRVDFDYEIIAVDDKSTDRTRDILKQYARLYPCIKVIEHTENQGNAIAFYDGLCAASGQYFCVLDGDDYYTVKNKLQKQVDFLDSDKEKAYVAVVHKYLRVNEHGQIYEDHHLFDRLTEYNYCDFIKQKFYFHTSTYMYRNIFRNQVPPIFKHELMRGDNPRTFMHVFYTKGKVKALDFIGSVYFYSSKGIWSQTSAEAQKERNIKMLEFLGENFSSILEQKYWQNAINYKRGKRTSNPVLWRSKEYWLQHLYRMTGQLAFTNKDFVFQSLYKSEFIDSFCESIGCISCAQRGLTPFSKAGTDTGAVLITISNLTPKGGGVFYEISDIVTMYSDRKVYILCTDVDSPDQLDQEALAYFKDFKNLSFLFGQKEVSNKVEKLVATVLSVAPDKIYHYLGHTNVYAATLVQSPFGKNICVFSFDHGFSLGVDNTSFDVYITKRPSDYHMLRAYYSNRVIYVPAFHTSKAGNEPYYPFKKHRRLITACAAARYYKLGSGKGLYADLILNLLKKTGGKHIHYGPIPDNELLEIRQKMKDISLKESQFLHIPWANNLPLSLHQNHVDIFIEPFPIVSYKITLDVLSAGVPVYVHESHTRMGMTDFIYDTPLKWKNKDDFISGLSCLTAADLKKQSDLARAYYKSHHKGQKVIASFKNELNDKTPAFVSCYDNTMIDISHVIDFWTIIPAFSVLQKTETVVPKIFAGKKNVWGRLRLKNRWKEIIYAFLIIWANIPILDLPFRRKRREKILKKLLFYWR